MKNKVKKRMHKTTDPTWDAYTYGSPRNPFDMEWIKYFNPIEGRDQIIFLYKEKKSGRICKHRILR